MTETTLAPVGVARWTAVAALFLGTFSLVTSEMLPVGLLTEMGADLNASDGVTGLVMTACGVVGGLSAPLLVTWRADRRLVLTGALGVLAVANLVAALAPNIVVLLAARLLAGLSFGGFWALAAGMAVRLVPAASVPRATAIILSGVSLASVVGVPAGTLLGDATSWRVATGVLGVLCMAVLAVLAFVLPPLPATQTLRLGDFPALLARPAVRACLGGLALVVVAHFASFTYVRPVLEDISGVDAGLVGTLLLVYGVAGVAGNFAVGALIPRLPYGATILAPALLAAAVLAIPLAGAGTGRAALLLAVWGVGYGAVPVVFQSWIMREAPDATEAGSAMVVTGFQVSIAFGSLLGGRMVDGISLTSVLWLAGVLAVASLALVWSSRPAPAR
ncbi:MFS transporter [Thermomonospora echinospora]|nr:MFS transporter [Thermomonospora echinospora]